MLTKTQRSALRLYAQAIADLMDEKPAGYLLYTLRVAQRLGVPERLLDAAFEFGWRARCLKCRFTAPPATECVN